MVTNYTEIPFITSDCPVAYNYIDFIPSLLKKENKLEPSVLTHKDSLIMFPLSTDHLILVQNFDKTRREPFLHYEDVFNEKKIIILNLLTYRFADRFVILKDKDNKLIQLIRNECDDELNKEYQLLEQTFEGIYSREKEYSEN